MFKFIKFFTVCGCLLTTYLLWGKGESNPLHHPLQSVQYICPMHTHIVKDHEGTCPICGMDLVLQQNNHSNEHSVEVSGAMQQAMAIQTALVATSTLERFTSSYGAVQLDETGLRHLHSRASGWIENLNANSVGQGIKKGELLYEIYAPDLLVAQEDFLALLNSKQQSAVLMERGERRLQLLGLNQDLIRQLKKTREVFYRVPYYAEQDGIVSSLNIRQGMYTEARHRLMTLADLSSVWVIAEVFASQADWVEVGQKVELDIPAADIFKLEGQIEFIYPTLHPVTRTLQVRLTVNNPKQLLKPDMLATLRVYAPPISALNIPVDALIQMAQNNRVFVQSADNQFSLREVEVGLITQGRAQVLAGLQAGERVVTSGQFLLDAEASLSNIASNMTVQTDSDIGHQH
ncbi:efflux RND transporter periplasmic adaptor subunit [Agaribacter flavus]|uniref:Efflux RND transporter periplasmic adaptor subunit n=1 Tax=Agaribacter flavus TaxID=1902781 RepID=A0ABV7FXR8_9ALTE